MSAPFEKPKEKPALVVCLVSWFIHSGGTAHQFSLIEFADSKLKTVIKVSRSAERNRQWPIDADRHFYVNVVTFLSASFTRKF